MAFILLRFRQSEQVRRAFADNPNFAQERIDALHELVGRCGFEFIDIARSVSTGEIVVAMRGSADNVILIQRVLDRTGAYDSLRAEILETVERLRENRSHVDEIGKTFSQPTATRSTACSLTSDRDRHLGRCI